MTEQSLSEMTFTMLSLLFLLLGVVLITSIVMSTFNPYQQITYANTEKLRASLDQACTTGQEVTINFDTPQNTPKFTGLFTILPIWMITTNGDPNFVLYYESFPAGQATGWEVYQNMQNRLLVNLPPGFEGKNYEEVEDYVQEVVEKANDKQVGLLEGVIVSNIILNDKYRTDFFFKEDASDGPTSTSEAWKQTHALLKEYGKWRDLDRNGAVSKGDNFFQFNNYAGLSTFEKSAIKYAPCGENSICLKTRDGVYRFPLNHCGDIKAVHIVYKALGDDTVLKERMEQIFDIGPTAAGTGFVNGFLKGLGWFKVLTSRISVLMWSGVVWTIGDLTTNMVERHIAFKVSDFYVASPCSIKAAVIKKVSCQTAQPEIPGYVDDEFRVCESRMEYPIYEFDKDGKIAKVGMRDMCIESTGKKFDTVPASVFAPSEQCIQIEIQRLKDEYCWTPDPYKDTTDGFWESFFMNDVIKESFLFFFDPPVHSNTAYLAESTEYPQQVLVLTPTDIALKRGESFFSSLGRKWWWGWP